MEREKSILQTVKQSLYTARRFDKALLDWKDYFRQTMQGCSLAAWLLKENRHGNMSNSDSLKSLAKFPLN